MVIPNKASNRPAWLRYLVAVALTVLVVGLRVALNPWWGLQQNRHLVLLPAVMLAAWLGGFRPGVVSACLSTLALHVLWSKAPSHLHWPRVDVVLFLAFSLVICAVVSSLQTARARADAATRSLERVLEVVAHDLRNPLTAIKALVTSIGHATPVVQPQLERIDRAVDRMDRLIGQLVESTRIGHGELTISARPESVEWLVQETIDSFSITARQREITLEAVEMPNDVLVHADRDRIIQVLGNLVGNALKFTPPGGRVTVTARVRNDVGRARRRGQRPRNRSRRPAPRLRAVLEIGRGRHRIGTVHRRSRGAGASRPHLGRVHARRRHDALLHAAHRVPRGAASGRDRAPPRARRRQRDTRRPASADPTALSSRRLRRSRRHDRGDDSAW